MFYSTIKTPFIMAKCPGKVHKKLYVPFLSIVNSIVSSSPPPSNLVWAIIDAFSEAGI